MVYTKHINIHKLKHLRHSKDYAEQAEKTLLDKTQDVSHLDNVFPYITNDDKTMSKQLVSGFGITNVYDAANEFIATKKLKAIAKGSGFELDPETGKMFFDTSSLENNNAILAHHLIQSFSPEDNLTPEQIHEIGRHTILEFTGEEHEFIIATHVDREHIHNHIIFNSTNLMTGKQFDWKVIQKGQTKSGKAFDVSKDKFEKVSDKIASKYGAKIIEKSPSTSHLKYTKWQTENLYKDMKKIIVGVGAILLGGGILIGSLFLPQRDPFVKQPSEMSPLKENKVDITENNRTISDFLRGYSTLSEMEKDGQTSGDNDNAYYIALDNKGEPGGWLVSPSGKSDKLMGEKVKKEKLQILFMPMIRTEQH